MTRAKDQARIDFLAQARNRALEPLWLNNSMATSTSLLLPHDTEVGCRSQSGPLLPGAIGSVEAHVVEPKATWVADATWCCILVIRLNLLRDFIHDTASS